MDKIVFSEGDIKSMQPLALAFLGDAVYEIFVREYVMNKGYRTVNALHKEAIKYVKASAQSMAIKELIKELNEQEEAVVKRGRNANPHTVPKNADVEDYRYATALECLFGYLKLQNNNERLEELMYRTIDIINGGYN